MRLSYQTRQALGVTCIVALTVIALSVVYLAAQARALLAESELRGRMLANATYQRAFALVRSRESAASDLQADPGLRAILLSAIGFAENVTYATITDVRDVALVHSSPTLEGTVVPAQGSLEQLLQGGPVHAVARRVGAAQLRSDAAAAARRRTLRVDPHRRLDGADLGRPQVGPQAHRHRRRRGDHPRHRRVLADGPTLPAAHPRVAERHRPSARRRGRRAPRPAGRGLQGPRHVVQRAQSIGLDDPIAAGRAGPSCRVGRRAARGRGGHRRHDR